jgi:hypothetical protein
VNSLAPGEHSVKVNVSDSGGNAGGTEWIFRIPSLPPDSNSETLR